MEGIFSQSGFMTGIKYGIFVIMCIYIIFAFILTRQLKLMNASFDTPVAGVLKLAGFVHFIASIIVTLLTFIVI